MCEKQAQSPPNDAIKPSNAISGPPNESSPSAVRDALVNAGSYENTEITSACYEPDARSTSWKPSKDCLLGKELKTEGFVHIWTY